MFGEVKDKSFNTGVLGDLVSKGLIEEAKEYVKSYMCKVVEPVGVLLWKPTTKTVSFYQDKDIKARFIKKYTNGKFDIQKWFFLEDPDNYEQVANVHKGRVYEDKGQKFVNIFNGYRFTEKKEYKSFDKETRRGVELIWNHVYTVWCSEKEDQYKYMKQWICNMISGIKMTTCIYLKGGQGVGKSVMTEFFQDVLGMDAAKISANAEIITGKFNASIANKMLLMLEEVPSDTKHKWQTFSNALKNYVTGKTVTIEGKGKDEYETENILSIMVISNYSALKLDIDDRRNLVADISNAKTNLPKEQKDAYWKPLWKARRSEKVQEAFFWYCIENADPDFDVFELPETESKKNIIIENLKSPAKYFKYMMEHKEKYFEEKEVNDEIYYYLYENFPIFYERYDKYCTKNGFKVHSKQEMGEFIEKDMKFEILTKGGNKRYISIEYNKLHQYFRKKKWIGEYDEISEQKNKKISKEEYEYMEEQYEKNEKYLKTMRKQLDLLEKYERRNRIEEYDTDDEIDEVIRLLK